MASAYLSRTTTSGTSYKKFTFSFWGKLSDPVATSSTFFGEYSDANNYTFWNVKDTSGDLQIMGYDGGSYEYNLITDRQLKDVNGWYHIVVAFDSTQSTASNRIKVYINGVQETSFSTETYPSLNLAPRIANGNRTQYVGWQGGSSNYWNGTMAHVHYISDTAYAASDFGSTDSTTGIWKPTTSPSVTYGTEGFFLDFADSSTMGNDVSGQNNDLTVSGTITQTIDTPSNVFATLNPLVYSSASKTYGHGNNSITASDSGSWCSTQSTLGASAGKYYWEVKINSVGSYQAIGVGYQPNITNTTSTQLIGELTGSAGWRNNGALPHGGSNLNTYTTGDILMIAMDLDNQKLYFGKNGTWENSGDPTSGATGTGSVKDLTANEYYHFVICPRGGSNYCNFGNGYFGTTAVSSAGTNSGIGTFEYDVPSGYKALCTKNINTQEYS